jgi:hypothetical protein
VKFILSVILQTATIFGYTQNMSGTWQGTITRGSGVFATKYKLELKLIAFGDSITGTSYYYSSKNNYYRYAIKGVRNTIDNTVHWWDDVLLEQKTPNVKIKAANAEPFTIMADFNCPGEGNMFLNGPATKQQQDNVQYKFDGKKVDRAIFNDEWSWVVDNYYNGAADKAIIDSVNNIARMNTTENVNNDVALQKTTTDITPNDNVALNIEQPKNETLVTNPFLKKEDPKKENVIPNNKVATKELQIDSLRWYVASRTNKDIDSINKPITLPATQIPNVNIQKFESRKTQQVISIPIEGEKIILKFYDNAIIDGDRIAVFLNKKLIKEHIYLTFDAQIIEIPVADLGIENELVMIAENLGSIPPNTSTLIVYVNNTRYEVAMESTEQKSASIRFYKKQ